MQFVKAYGVTGYMNPKSNTLARIVRIASKIKMRQNDIKTRSIFGVIHGLALHLLV